MKLKEEIKSKVDKLDPGELRIVEILIDSLSGNRKLRCRKTTQRKNFYEDVINMIGAPGLTSVDIDFGREERV